jgi:hypothetical protein
MTYPKRTKGFRSITVNGAPYRWCFHLGQNDSTVTLQGQESSGQQASVTLPGVGDPWLAMPKGEITRPALVTPAIVRQIVKEALSRGWKPDKRIAPLNFDFIIHAAA